MPVLKHIDFQISDWGELESSPVQRPSYAQEVLADSPLMYLCLNETSGSTAFDQIGQHNAAVDGTVVWGMDGPMPFYGNTGLEGVGTGGLIVSETGWLPIGSSQRTIEMWVRPKVNTILYEAVTYGSPLAGQYLLLSVTNSELSVNVMGCKFGVNGLSLAGQWHHVAVVFPNGATRSDAFLFYLDGQLMNSVVLVGSGSTLVNTADTPFQINQIGAGFSNYCDYADVAVYETALSSQRISEHYFAGALAGA